VTAPATSPACSQEAPPVDKRSRKGYVLWGVALAALLTVGLFCWLVVVPILQTDAALKRLKATGPKWPESPANDQMQLAIDELGGTREAVRHIRFYLRIPDCLAEEKNIAVLVLAYCGKSAVDTLSGSLRDGDPARAHLVLWGLATIGEDAYAAVPNIVPFLLHHDPEVQDQAARALYHIGPKAHAAIPNLILLTKSDVLVARITAAAALGRMGGQRSTNALVGLLQDSDWQMRGTAALALGEIGASAKKAVPALIRALRDDDENVRACAAHALGGIGPDAKQGLTALTEALTDASWLVRGDAAWAIGQLGTDADRVVAPLELLLKDKNRSVRRIAEKALKKIKEAAGK
jgi:HEAT repeat protein